TALYSRLSPSLPSLFPPARFIFTPHLPVSSASVSKSFLPTLQHSCLYQETYAIICFLFSFFFHTEAPGFVTLDHSLRYYPSITYGVIGSAIIFVLVVALLALVLHHQRKRSVLLPRSVRGSTHHHQPLLLSRLVILDRGHANARGLGLSPGSSSAAGQYTAAPQAFHLLSGAMYPSSVSLDSPPSYSESVLDVSRPPWFDLPPPPYVKDSELSSEGNLPQYDDLQDGLSHRTSPGSASPPPRMLPPDSQTGPSPTEESDQL
ncbi:low-density lipoprotein receptor class A domain-containing protein 3-like, partial [Poecilia latipinna]|uniref:low-density lipoprotein receptor class A domain-containing protein 3-like n=1 Tax=Poecilia latipinna TaxID=48699 RepID=UPI00072EC4C7